MLRESGCLTLPSQRTLRDYTYYNIGFSAATDNDQFIKDYEPWQKTVGLTLDEMYIHEGIVFDKSTGKLIGFTDLGDITNHLQW